MQRHCCDVRVTVTSHVTRAGQVTPPPLPTLQLVVTDKNCYQLRLSALDTTVLTRWEHYITLHYVTLHYMSRRGEMRSHNIALQVILKVAVRKPKVQVSFHCMCKTAVFVFIL